jgi:hypothetical protein
MFEAEEKLALKEVMILHRPYKQWRRKLRAVILGKWDTGSTRSTFGRKKFKKYKVKIY